MRRTAVGAIKPMTAKTKNVVGSGAAASGLLTSKRSLVAPD